MKRNKTTIRSWQDLQLNNYDCPTSMICWINNQMKEWLYDFMTVWPYGCNYNINSWHLELIECPCDRTAMTGWLYVYNHVTRSLWASDWTNTTGWPTGPLWPSDRVTGRLDDHNRLPGWLYVPLPMPEVVPEVRVRSSEDGTEDGRCQGIRTS